MKRLKVCLFVLLFVSMTYAQTQMANEALFDLLKNGYTEGIGKHFFNYKDNQFIFNKETDSYEEVFRSSVEIEHVSGLTYLKLPEAEKRFLCLANEIVFLLYEEVSNEPYFMGFWSSRGIEVIHRFKPDVFTASSELKEGSIIYSAGNLASFNLKTPWVEGVPGNGIGESVSFYLSDKYLYLFSGYISYDKPYLYEQNSRPKKIRITVTDKGNAQEFIFDLEDTPNPQTLEFPERMYGDAKLEILDVYPGSKYQDTCIHAILGKCF